MGFVLRWVLTGVAVAVALWVVPGFSFVGTQWVAIALTALVLALINASIKPVLSLLSLPITVLTLGLFALVLNALMLLLASWLSVNLFHTGIVIAGFWWAMLGALVISVASAVINLLVGEIAE